MPPLGARAPAAPSEQSPATGPIPLRRRRIGESPLRVFPVGLNGFGFGSSVAPDTACEILDTYLALGGNFIDTDARRGGVSEAFVGRWMHSRGARSSVILTATVGSRLDSPGVTKRAMGNAVDLTLERLQTDYIDLLMVDLDDASVPFEETLLAVDALVGTGKVRYAGAADHDANRLVEARVIAGLLGLAPLVAARCEYSLAHRWGFEGSLSGVIAEQGLGALPFSVPARAKRRRRTGAALDRIAREHNLPAATIAFAWLLTKPDVSAPVAEVSDAEQVLDLVAATTVQLTRHQVAALDKASG